MTPFTAIAGKQKIKFNVPSGYEDLTLGQYIAISKFDGHGILNLVQDLTGLSQEVIDQTTEDEAMRKIVHLLQWATIAPTFLDKEKDDYEPLPVPDKLTFDKEEYEVPQEIELKTFGQKISVQLHLSMAQKKETTIAECMPLIIAIYMQPIVTGEPYQEDKAKKLLPAINKMNLLDAYAVADFFLRSSTQLLNEKSSNCLTGRTVISQMQELISFSRTAYSQRSTRWLKAIFSSTTKFFSCRTGKSLVS